MPRNPEQDTSYAKAVALKYIARAPRTIKEVELKLKEKGVTGNTIKEIIDYLTGLGYLDDEAFARAWADSRIKSRLWGKRRIIHSLKQKGVVEGIIEQVVETIGRETDELNTARTALDKWLKNKVRGSEVWNNKNLKQKVFRHLQTKGFSTSVIITAIKEKMGELEADEL